MANDQDGAGRRGAPTTAHWLVLDAEGISHIDTTGMEALKNLVDELRDGGAALVVARMRTSLQGLVDDAGLQSKIGAEHFYPTVRAAVHACVRQESAAVRETPSASPLLSGRTGGSARGRADH